MPIQERERLAEPLHYEETPVRFSMSKCDTNDYCIRKLQRNEVEALYKRFGHVEQMTWRQFKQMPRENGLSIEPRNSTTHEMLTRKVAGVTTFGHFRVNGTDSNIRIFIGLDRGLGK